MAKIKTMQVNLSYLDVIGLTAPGTKYIFIIPPNVYPLHYLGRVKTAFAGAAKPTIELGDETQTTIHIPKQHIDAVGELISGAVDPSRDGFCAKLSHPRQKTSLNQIVATIRVASGALLSTLSAGEVEFILVYAEGE